jgi:Ca-activated chloride channel homolog
VSRPQFRILLLTVLLFAAVASMQRPASAAQPTQQSPSFRAGVDVVSLSVTVTDRMNRYVTDLDLPPNAIYTNALRGDDTQTRGFREAEFVLRSLAQDTGGRAFFPAKIEDLAGVYAQIGDELASQYTLGYTSKNPRRDGAWRRVIVQLSRPNMIARAKNGYYASTAR